MTAINKYLLLLLIFGFGFSINEHHQENIVIDWNPSEDPYNILGYTFEDAGYEWESSQPVPVFVKEYFLNSPDENFIIKIDDPVYEALELNNEHFQINLLPHQSEFTQTRVVSGNSHKIVLKVPAVIQRNGKVLVLKKFNLTQMPV